MILEIKGPYGQHYEIGHCSVCGREFDADELWEKELELCPVCYTPLYTPDNPEHFIMLYSYEEGPRLKLPGFRVGGLFTEEIDYE
jgi:hypothetical protein